MLLLKFIYSLKFIYRQDAKAAKKTNQRQKK